MLLPEFLQTRFNRWLGHRLPAAQRVRLNQSGLFIFPSRPGFGFLLLIALLWLLATNYENNLVFAVACLLSSLFVTAILHSYANLAGLELSFVSAEPVFATQQMLFKVVVQRTDNRARQGLHLRFRGGGSRQTAELLESEQQVVALASTASRRGWCCPGRVTIESRYPLGLFRVWTHLDLTCRGLVYPQPLSGEPQQLTVARGVAGQKQATVGSDDFAGFKDYQSGEPLQHVAWKHYARERGLLNKQYADAIDERIWLNWDDYPGCDREARLSRLCGRLLAVSQQQIEYGLRLPGVEIPLGHGDSHKQQILHALALFELTGDEVQK